MEGYGAEQLGLVRVDEYVRQDAEEDIENESDDEETLDISDAGTYKEQIVGLLKGQRIHTQYGEGIDTSVAPYAKLLTIRLDTNIGVKVKFSEAFLITRKETSGKDIRIALAKEAGDLPLDTPIDVPPTVAKAKRITQKELKEIEKRKLEKEKENLSSLIVELQFTVTNGFLGLTMFTNGEDSPGTRALQALGFSMVPDFYYAQLKNHLQLYNQITLWNKKNLVPDQSIINTLGDNGTIVQLYNLLKSKKIGNRMAVYKFANRSQLRNFYRMEIIPSKDPMVIKPYPIIEDGAAYLALPIRGQQGTRKAMRYKAPGIIWHRSEPQLAWYGMTPALLSNMLKKIVNAGITISNLDELKADWKNIKKVQIRQNVFESDQ